MGNRRRIWFLFHSWITLPIWALFSFICLTGTISVISHEITWMVNPASRASNPNQLPRKKLDELIIAAKNSVPSSIVTNIMIFEPYLVTAISLTSKEKPSVIAYVNPYTAQVQELVEGMTFIGFMRSLHAWLLFPWRHGYSIGYYLVTSLSLMLLGATLSGAIVYKQLWKAYFRPQIRLREGIRKALGDIHKNVGAWSIWFFVIIGLTGLWYLIQAIMWHNNIAIEPEIKPLSIEQIPYQPETHQRVISIADAVNAAQEKFSLFQPAWISVPEHSRGYYEVAGKGDTILFDEYSSKVTINPWTGDVVKTQQPLTMGMLQKISHIVDPLHYGKFGGLVTKVIWFLFGSLLTGMSITGFMIWIKRTAHNPSKYISKKLFLINIVIIFIPFWFIYAAFNPSTPKSLGQKQIDSLTIEAFPHNSNQPYSDKVGFKKDFSFEVCKDCASKIRLAYAKIGAASPEISENTEGILHGHGDTLHSHVPSPQTITSNDRLWVSIQKWDGTIEDVFWDINLKSN